MNLRLLSPAWVLLALAIVRSAAATTHYVAANGTNPVVPYTSWATAATNIQDAVDIGGPGDTFLVTNGIYQYGGYDDVGSNRVHLVNNQTVQSVNGPAVTFIVGYQVPGTTNGSSAVRCVYLNVGTTLSGFTLTNGATPTSGGAYYGGGVYCAGTDCLVTNCVITGNAAAQFGGGAYRGSLLNCVINGNRSLTGGGVYSSSLTNCTVTGNNAGTGSGLGSGNAYNCLFTGNTNASAASFSTLNNCTLVGNFSSGFGAANGCKLNNSIIYYNSNGIYADCYQCTLTNCCTPLGFGVFTLPVNSVSNAPSFLDAAHGNYRLQIGSPGVDGGTNIYVAGTTDLDGNPRIVNGTVDMGAYENQNTGPVHYVKMTNGTPVAPYTNWLTAATNIQDAVAVALPGDFVVVSNGIYKGGGGIMFGSESNRVMLTNAITLQGLYGASSTVIVGSALPTSATRCVYVGSNSVLYGFTLANGQTRTAGDIIKEQSGGGAWCETGGVISNCFFGGRDFPYANGNTPDDSCGANQAGGAVYGGSIFNSTLANNSAVNLGGAAAAAVLVNCVVETNSCSFGFAGGLYQGRATNCIFMGNAQTQPFVGRAGGAYQSTLDHCTFFHNSGPAGGTALSTNYTCTFINNGGDTGGAANGGFLYNCLVLSNTASSGGGAYQSTLTGCLVISNRATGSGGGVYQCTVYNSTLSTNTASVGNGGGANGGNLFNCTISGNYGGGAVASTLYGCCLTGNTNSQGGGAFSSTLVNCLISGNYATGSGGGASGGTLRNCTVVSNAATQVGGVINGTIFNSIIYYNSIVFGTATNYSGGALSYCDTFPAPGDFGSITNEPLLVNLTTDLHLQNNSPCINSGNNAYLVTNVDFALNPRIKGGTVDIGAYEFQTPSSIVSYAFLQRYGFPTDGSADFADPDGDGMNNYREWKTGTIPTDAASVLRMSSPTNTLAGMIVTWQSVPSMTYFLQRSTNLTAQPPFSTIQSNIVGQVGATTYTDASATNGNSFFYRVGVQ